MFANDFQGRVLPFDSAAAVAYAKMFAAPPRGWAACPHHRPHAGLLTRNVTDFDGIGLTIINPWDD